jgi:hypothetical protein
MLTILAAIAVLAQPAAPQVVPPPAQKPATPTVQAAPIDAIEKLRADAAAVAPLVHHDCTRHFLNATTSLPRIEPRVVYSQREPRAAFSESDAAKLPQDQRDKLRKLEFDTAKYYDTFYGSPLAYARALDLCAAAGLDACAGMKVIDYGYGTVGHLRLLASLGAEAIGIDVDPILPVLYGQPGDTGEIPSSMPSGKPGKLTLVNGFWPGTPEVRSQAGGGADLFISKNTLKNGYVHPAEGVDKRRTLTLGVTDEEFVKAVFDTVKPGGLVMIYNIGPAPAPPDKPVIPWADIRCPFPRGMWESAGFKVIQFEKDDKPEFVPFAKALGWDTGESPMDLDKDLFVSYTLLRRP